MWGTVQSSGKYLSTWNFANGQKGKGHHRLEVWHIPEEIIQDTSAAISKGNKIAFKQ